MRKSDIVLKYMQRQIHHGYYKNEKIIRYLFNPQDFHHLGPENEEEHNELCEALEKSLQEIDASMVPVPKKCYSTQLCSYRRRFLIPVLEESS